MAKNFGQLFWELDGKCDEHRHDVTEACIDALFERVLIPPMLLTEKTSPEDVDAAERLLIGLIKKEAARWREELFGSNP